jgi:hypothetical protein
MLSSNQKRNSIDSYQSPLSVQYPHPPASMPPYYAVPTPLTPMQKGPASAHPSMTNNPNNSNNFNNSSSQQDSFYMAPHSVPTPSKSSSTSMLAGANNQNDNQASGAHQQQQHQQSQQPGQLQSQVSFNLNTSIDMTLPKSVGPPGSAYQKSSIPSNANRQRQMNLSASFPNSKLNTSNSNKPMSKMASYVLNIPVPPFDAYKHERNQRFIVLYGFGAKK